MKERPEHHAPKGRPKGMRPETRRAFEESYKRNEEAMRRLAEL